MGWFWAEPAAPASASQMPAGHPPVAASREPPAGCPMHNKTMDALNPGQKQQAPAAPAAPAASGCPVPHESRIPTPPASGCPVPHESRVPAAPASGCPVPHEARTEEKPQSLLSQLNPLNYMFPDLSQKPAPNQKIVLPTEREASTIPKSTGDGNWEYPSPQQMYNALLRKGYTDTDVTAVESMVSVHNFLNEGAWEEILDWERRFGRGLYRGWQVCKRGEAHVDEELDRHWDGNDTTPTLIRFQGRPKDMTPRATMLQVLGWIYPSKFATEPPFDRHDWYVSRKVDGQEKEIRYVIDYYSGEPEPSGEPVFYLDVRPAATPLGAAERVIRWGTDVWWKAIGGDKREQDPQPFFRHNATKPWG